MVLNMYENERQKNEERCEIMDRQAPGTLTGDKYCDIDIVYERQTSHISYSL